ncbi:MAG: glycosyltransferase family 4 protein [Acidobacteriota bacterium]
MPDPARLPAVDVVSPLPPVRSGISDYTVDLLPELARRLDLRLVRLPGQEVDGALADRFTVVDAERLGEPGPDGGPRLPLYQMGNNQHHADVWRLAMERPGVLVLHDLVLHHFLIERTVADGDFDAYRRQLTADHGWIGEAASLPMRWPGGVGSAAQFALPAHRTLLARQRGVLVHSRWAEGYLAEEIPQLRVRRLPMGVPLPPPASEGDGKRFRERHGLPAGAPVIGSFGFQTPMKRTGVVIETLARPGLEDVHLMVAGEVAEILELGEAAEAAGVADRVHVLGYLPFDEFEAGIAACDLTLNLRYPTAGETSASLLRILAVGRPAIVSDHAQMAELPDDIAVKVPVGDGEVDALAERLLTLLADRSALRRMGEGARRFVAESHRPAAAAEAVAEACRAFADLDPREIAPPAPGRPTSLACRSLPGEVRVEGAEGPWRTGERRRLEIILRNTGEARWLAGERLGGGVAVQVKLWADGVDLWADRGWIGLPKDLGPGDGARLEVTLRRPLAETVRLEVLPHVLGFTGLPELDGPSWGADL